MVRGYVSDEQGVVREDRFAQERLLSADCNSTRARKPGFWMYFSASGKHGLMEG